MTEQNSKRSILLASGAALAGAIALLVMVVLPAEYGWDPLGSGEALGLTAMTGDSSTALQQQPQPWQADQRVFQLAPFEAVEFKYRLAAGAVFLFDWQANDEVIFDMHAEPDGAAPGYAQSFEKSRGSSSQGSYTATFDGIHGWFWQNRTQQDITVTLKANGYFTSGKEIRDGREFEYAF